MDEGTKTQVTGRLRRIAGQVEGIERMIEQDRAEVDVLLQLASAEAAITEAGKLVLRSHVNACIAGALSARNATERKRKLDELLNVFARYACMKPQ